MRNRHDQLAKQLGHAALAPFGVTEVQKAISAEVQYADLRHEPDPARSEGREKLGLLGQLTARPCLIEVYSQAPGAEEFRACLVKHLVAWQERGRAAKRDGTEGETFLWIIAAGVPVTLLEWLEPKAAKDLPRGVYLVGGPVLRVGLVVASELPRDRMSLLVRLMAGGALLPAAIKDVVALPPGEYERVTAEPILLQLQHLLEAKPNRDPDEQETLMAMFTSWEDGKAEAREEGREQGRREGEARGRLTGTAEGRAAALMTVLRLRGIAVPDAARARISTEVDAAVLERWLERALAAASIDDVLG